MKNSKHKPLAFDKPIKSDWAFWVLIIFFTINLFSAFKSSYSETSFRELTSVGLLAAAIDLLILPLITAAIIPTSILLLIRYFIQKVNSNDLDQTEDGIVGNLNFEKQTRTIQVTLPKIFSLKFLTITVFLALIFIAGLVYKNFDFSSSQLSGQIKDSAPQIGTLKQKPSPLAEISPSPVEEEATTTMTTPSKSASPKPSKSASPTPTNTPVPVPTISWWPDYFSPYGTTIAYKYNHYFSKDCDTAPGDPTKCRGGHAIEVRVTEPCSAMSFDIRDDSDTRDNLDTTYVIYFTRYISTGQTFAESISDPTPTTAGRVIAVACIP